APLPLLPETLVDQCAFSLSQLPCDEPCVQPTHAGPMSPPRSSRARGHFFSVSRARSSLPGENVAHALGERKKRANTAQNTPLNPTMPPTSARDTLRCAGRTGG